MIAAPLFHSWGFFHFVMSLPTASTMVLRRRFDPEGTLRAVERKPRRRAGGGAGDDPADPRPAGGDARPPTSSPRCGSPRSRARRCRASWRSSGWTASATPSTTSTARPRSPTRPSPPRPTCAPPRAPPANRRAGPPCGLFDEHGHGGAAGRGRADLRRQRDVLRGLHRRRRQGGRSTACSRSGDVGHIDADGRLFIDGRDDEMIVSGGENVFPREVEDLLADHEAVVEVAVIGVEDAEFGQRLKAFVVAQGRERALRGRPQGPRQGEPRLLQDAARGRVPRRAAPQRHRQGPEARAACARGQQSA